MKTLSQLVEEIISLETPKRCPFDDDGFNEALAKIQKEIGVESGDEASVFFDTFEENLWKTGEREARIDIISRYINHELECLLIYQYQIAKSA